jgi:hypothetical protein
VNRLNILIILSLTLFGCGHDHDDHNHGDEAEHSLADIETEACAHMQSGPATAVIAGAEISLAINTEHSDWEHKRVDLTLDADQEGTGYVGYVTYESESADDYIVFSDVDVAITIADQQPESQAEVSACEDIDEAYIFELEVGEHVVEVRSTSSSVRLLFEPVGADHDH